MSLIESLHKEMNRVRELRTEYVAIGPAGGFGVATIDVAIQCAEKAIEEDNVVKILQSYEELKSITG